MAMRLKRRRHVHAHIDTDGPPGGTSEELPLISAWTVTGLPPATYFPSMAPTLEEKTPPACVFVFVIQYVCVLVC